MCGISGYLDLDRGVDIGILRRMTDVIRHRGPDDEGYALIGPGGTSFFGGNDTVKGLEVPPLETAVGTASFLGFGHRRLSILDLSVGGHQPMYLPERDITLIYNGELYNYMELRAQLEALGYTFHTTSDTEVLLYAYCEWGEDCLTQFNGMWGFALWDGQENKLFCARDRLGAKPFHYWRQGNRIMFGSELKQLCQDGAVQRRFDTSYLAANLIYHISDYNDQTLIEGMKTLRPGHKLVVQLGAGHNTIDSFTLSSYWTLHVHSDNSKTEAEWVRLVTEEFSRSCRWRMRSDAPLGALLSGGLDSSCMVTEMCSQMEDPSRLQTFTTSYPGNNSCDEWFFADLINRSCGCTGNQILPDAEDIEKRFENLVWHVEGSCGLSLLGSKFLLDEINRRGYKVILNGQCGDELMLGYERYYAFFFASLIKRKQWKTLVSEFRQASRHSKLSVRDLAAYALYFNQPVVRDSRQLHRAGRFINPDLLDQRNRVELRELLYPKILENLQYTELTATQLTHIVRYDDRLYMSASIESRIPFMDYQFVELCCRIPPEYKIKNGYTKYLMRQAFDRRMPREVTWRTNKMGFGAPVTQWGRRFSRDYLLAYIEDCRTEKYFKKEALAQMVTRNQAEPSIYEFLAVELFARQFDVS